MKKRPRGRPKGHRLSEESKAKISKTKTGQYHTAVTREKISNSLIFYFKCTPEGEAACRATSERLKGKPRKAEDIAKQKVAQRKYWARVKKALEGKKCKKVTGEQLSLPFK